MKAILLAVAASLSLTGCVTLAEAISDVLSPENCSTVLAAADTVDEIAKLLIDRGIEVDTARTVAEYVAQGRLAVSEVCSVLYPPATPAVQPDPNLRVATLVEPLQTQ